MNWQAARDDSRVLVVNSLTGIADIPLSIVTFRYTLRDGFAALAAKFHVGEYKRYAWLE